MNASCVSSRTSALAVFTSLSVTYKNGHARFYKPNLVACLVGWRGNNTLDLMAFNLF